MFENGRRGGFVCVLEVRFLHGKRRARLEDAGLRVGSEFSETPG